MAIQLFGNPFNLQGGFNPQQAANPQQTANPQQANTPAPVAPKPAAPRPAPRPAQPAVPQLVTTGLVGSTFSNYIGARPSPSNPSVAEFYRTDTNQALDQRGLFSYASSLGLGQISSFEQLKANAPQYSGNNQSGLDPNQDPNQRLAQSAGLGGLSYDDYQKIVQGQSGLTQAEKDQIRQSLGIPDLESSLFTPPAKSTQQLYNDAYASAGLADLKQKIAALDASISVKKQQLTDAQGKVNENPFLSENSRVGRNRRVSEQAELTIGNLIDQQNQYKDLYNSGIGEISNLVSRQGADFSANQQLNAQKLQYLLSKAEEQVRSKQSEKSSAALQYLPDYLKAKAKAQKPETIGSNETGFYRWNSDTQTFEQVIGPSVTPNYQANPLTGELFNTKDGSSLGAGNTAATLAQAVANNPAAYDNLTAPQKALVNNYLAQQGQTIPGAPATDAQNISANYALRMQQSGEILKNLTNNITTYNPAGFEAQIRLPSYAQSDNIQSYMQAARNFINAVLRRESGAVISPSEFANAYQQYLPRPGDSQQTLSQKTQNRDSVLRGFINASGSAWQGLTGQQPGGAANPSDPLGLFSSAGNASASTPYLKTLGKVTGENGSSLWSYGLDVDLKKGDPVRSPVTGKVIAAASNGGFGNQVKIRTNDGQEIWLSHLQSGSVKVGQIVNAGQIVGIGGNSGNTIAGKGGDGSHLDITMKDSKGRLLTARQVKSFLDNIYV